MRRFKQELESAECERILREGKRGVLALLGDGGYPYAFPMNFVYSEGKIIFHCALEGHKTDAIKKCEKASFCVIDEPEKRDENEWWYYVKSVIAFGKIRIVEDRDMARENLRLLGLKYYPSAKEVSEELRKDFSRANCLELKIEHLSGKQVQEK